MKDWREYVTRKPLSSAKPELLSIKVLYNDGSPPNIFKKYPGDMVDLIKRYFRRNGYLRSQKWHLVVIAQPGDRTYDNCEEEVWRDWNELSSIKRLSDNLDYLLDARYMYLVKDKDCDKAISRAKEDLCHSKLGLINSSLVLE
jgi:hypothetical protein